LIEKVVSQVEFEIEQVDCLLESYADLLERVQVGRAIVRGWGADEKRYATISGWFEWVIGG
jgi:hypothetical protein